MAFVAVLFWLLIAAFLGGGLLVSGFLWRRGTKQARPGLRKFGLVVFSGFSALITFLIISFAISEWRSRLPEPAFGAIFHTPPPPGTVLLHGFQTGFADSAGRTVAFRADRATFDRLRPPHLKRATLNEYQSFSTERPSWWRQPGPDTELWLSDSQHWEIPYTKEFGTEITWMTWDADGLVQYDWLGID